MKISEITPAQVLDYLKTVDKKTWIKIGIGVSIGTLLLIFVIYPAWIGRVGLKTQLEAVRGQVAQTNNLFRKKPELMSAKEQCIEFTQKSKEKLYTPSEASLLLGTISKMANDSGVSIVASKPRAADGKFPVPFDSLYESSYYDVTLEGGYHALGEFVSKIESNSKILRIQSLSFHPKEKEEDEAVDAKPRLFADITLAAISVKVKAK